MRARNGFAKTMLAAAGLVLTSAPALASDRSVEVRYDDLDLSSDNGASTLQQRVKRAVQKVCGRADIRNITEMQDMQRCRNEASARSSRDVALAMESARNGERLASLTVEK